MPKITTAKGGGFSGAKISAALFVLVIAAVYLFGLDIPFVGPDEPRYAQVAREMFGRGDWLTPTLGGFNWFEKPVLLYWLEIISYYIFGVNEFAARFGPALFGLGTAFCVWWLGKSTGTAAGSTDDSADRNSKEGFAFWAGLVTASSLGLIVFARGATFDIILTFPLTASLVCFFIWDSRQATEVRESNLRGPVKYLLFFYVFVGIAVLAKGLVGIVLPFAAIGLYYVLQRRIPDKTSLLSLLWGAAIIALVASVWYLPMYLTHGREFIDEFFVRHHFQRFTSNKFKHPGPVWFFWLIFPLMTIPWIPLFLVSFWKYGKRIVSGYAEGIRMNAFIDRNAKPDINAFAFAWMLVPLVFFSFSGSKLPGYVLPALPAACLLTARFVDGLVWKRPRTALFLKAAVILMFGVTVSLLQFVLPDYAASDSVKQLVRMADERGYSEASVAGLYTASHSAEFYAAGRLLRKPDGAQKFFESVYEINVFLRDRENGRLLVLVPNRLVAHITDDAKIDSSVLGENAELTLVAVEPSGENPLK